jgi:hypothetical protein
VILRLTLRHAPIALLVVLAACGPAVPRPASTPAPRPAPSRPTPRPTPRPASTTVPMPPPNPPAAAAATGFRAPQVLRVPGLETVIEADADSLIRQFGTPQLDVNEGDMRKLQFAGEACVLDLFLYPMREGGKPVATWIDSRRASDGLDVDRRACVEALRKR